jgi:predicted transcriptional regulator
LLDQEPDNVVISAHKMRDTTVSFKIDRAMKAKLVALAKAEDRTLSNFIEKILKTEIQKHESKTKSSPH